MRAAVLHAAKDIRIEPRAVEPLGEGQVRVQFRAGGICGSDIHYYSQGRNGDFVVVEPLVLGHEIAGDVVEVGAAAGASTKVGDRVALYPARTCGTCSYCREGRDNLCPETFFMGSASKRPHMQGGFQELLTVDADQCYVVPADLEHVYAAFAEPLAVCLHAINRAGDLKGRSVLVTGVGPIGLILMMAARWSGAATIVVTDLVDEALAAARRLGADEAVAVADADRLAAVSQGLGGFDVVLEASGSPAAVETAMEHVRRGGIIMQVGGLPGGTVPIPAFRIMAKELEMRGSMRFTRAAFETSVRLITTGEIDIRPLLTDQQPLDNVAAAIELASDRRRAIKVMITS